MKHLDPSDAERAAEPVLGTGPTVIMSRSERIRRWAKLLDETDIPIQTLHRVEWHARTERRAIRGPFSPMAVAYADPILRGQGLTGETLGECMDFFELSDYHVHELFCDCHLQGTLTGTGLAQRLRRMTPDHIGLWRRMRALLAKRSPRVSGATPSHVYGSQ